MISIEIYRHGQASQKLVDVVGLTPSPHVVSKASKVPPGHQPPRQHQESDLAVKVSLFWPTAKSDDRDDPWGWKDPKPYLLWWSWM